MSRLIWSNEELREIVVKQPPPAASGSPVKVREVEVAVEKGRG